MRQVVAHLIVDDQVDAAADVEVGQGCWGPIVSGGSDAHRKRTELERLGADALALERRVAVDLDAQDLVPELVAVFQAAKRDLKTSGVAQPDGRDGFKMRGVREEMDAMRRARKGRSAEEVGKDVARRAPLQKGLGDLGLASKLRAISGLGETTEGRTDLSHEEGKIKGE